MNTVLETLIAGRKRIETPRRWCKGVAKGGRVCALAALPANGRIIDAVLALEAHLPSGRRLVPFNDHPTTTHADILALYDRAIEAARKATP